MSTPVDNWRKPFKIKWWVLRTAATLSIPSDDSQMYSPPQRKVLWGQNSFRSSMGPFWKDSNWRHNAAKVVGSFPDRIPLWNFCFAIVTFLIAFFDLPVWVVGFHGSWQWLSEPIEWHLWKPWMGKEWLTIPSAKKCPFFEIFWMVKVSLRRNENLCWTINANCTELVWTLGLMEKWAPEDRPCLVRLSFAAVRAFRVPKNTISWVPTIGFLCQLPQSSLGWVFINESVFTLRVSPSNIVAVYVVVSFFSGIGRGWLIFFLLFRVVIVVVIITFLFINYSFSSTSSSAVCPKGGVVAASSSSEASMVKLWLMMLYCVKIEKSSKLNFFNCRAPRRSNVAPCDSPNTSFRSLGGCWGPNYFMGEKKFTYLWGEKLNPQSVKNLIHRR